MNPPAWARALALAALALVTTGSSCAGVKPRPDGHHTCTEASDHRAALGCKFQDGFFARCSAVGSVPFNDCVFRAGACGDIDNCDPALHKQ